MFFINYKSFFSNIWSVLCQEEISFDSHKRVLRNSGYFITSYAEKVGLPQYFDKKTGWVKERCCGAGKLFFLKK